MKVRDFLRLARAHQPEESLRAFMDPLADAVCCAAKWLKSSLERLSENLRHVQASLPPRHRRMDECLSRRVQPLVVLAHTPVVGEIHAKVRSATHRRGRFAKSGRLASLPKSILVSGGSFVLYYRCLDDRSLY